MLTFHQIVSSSLAILVGAYLFTGSRRRMLHILYKTLPRDILGAYRFIKTSICLWWWQYKNYNVPRLFTTNVDRHPEKVVFIYDDQKWTYRKVDEYSNRIGRYFKKENFSRGDSIALFMTGQVEYIGTWLGLSKIGFVAALVNTNLRKDVLIHSITAANCKAIIFSADLQDAVKDIQKEIHSLTLYQWCEDSVAPVLQNVIDLNCVLKSISPARLTEDLSLGMPKDKIMYIYTSGTTGVPKAAVISHIRFMMMTCGVYHMLGLKPTDRMYTPLPLYHTAAGIIGVGQGLLNGIPVVFRKRFSASKFWSDCIKYDCTVAQYIGEICRFMLTVPPSPNDKFHKIRLMFGNGLRPQIWKAFVERFGVKQIGELYGATEGVSNLVNIDNTIGAVGFVPRYAGKLYPVILLKINEETGEPVRDSNGFCIPCKPGESGILVGKIDPKKVIMDFSGYADEEASKKKIIHDVFTKGDKVFNSGDILVMDEYGYFYFKDRTGDTFRWRGENVSTSEVEAVISNIIELKDVIVYGVEVPKVEGKAGMTAIHLPNSQIDLNHLFEECKKVIPSYAIPLFIRILPDLPMTGTFKLKKRKLQEEGFDISKVKDDLYFLYNQKYIKITKDVYDDIISGKFKL